MQGQCLTSFNVNTNETIQTKQEFRITRRKVKAFLHGVPKKPVKGTQQSPTDTCC